MPYSCSDFTSNLINHLFNNGLIPAAVADSDDLEHQATEAMAAISDLAERAKEPPAPATGSAANVDTLRATTPAARFMDELLGEHETLTRIAEAYNDRTLADCMYLLSALHKGTSIEVHHPSESHILAIVEALPSWNEWTAYVHEVTE